MTEWLNTYRICEMKTGLERENSSDNKKVGRYVEIYAEDKQGVYCQAGTKGIGHPLVSFEVRTAQWTGLEKAFADAGYEIRRKSLVAK